VNTATYDADPTLRSLIDVAPFGVEEQPPSSATRALKGVVPGIGVDDVVLLWGGGVYNWFDPLTLIRAVAKVHAEHPHVRLYFLGMSHPNPDVPRMRMAAHAVALSDRLELTGRVVFFNTGWVPYDERADYLLDADVGVSTHLDHVETAFSFRTRILDYLWAGLPVVTTGGDALADVVVGAGAGVAVPPDDVDALAAAIAALVAHPAERARLADGARTAAAAFRWSTVLRPLVEFCGDPRRAPDLVDPLLAPGLDPMRITVPSNPTSVRGDVALAASYLREGGVGLLARRVGTRARRMFRNR
ncbi:MAG TPA: glycosyltransferase, partial [Mycobacteriales bacterium]|nr:glycosyltransferase [Mycobacteriales bacterium]